MEFDEESLYSYACDCGADFPLADNRVDDGTIICPSCGRKYYVPKKIEDWIREDG